MTFWQSPVVLTVLALGLCSSASANVAFNGTLIEPPPCTINGGSTIEVDFKEVGISKVDGEHYRQPVNYTITCSTDTLPWEMILTVRGSATSFESSAVQSSVVDLGIKLLQNGKPMELNTPLVVTPNSPPVLEAVPVKRPGSTLAPGGFTAIGELPMRSRTMRSVIATLAISVATAYLLASQVQAADNLSFKGVLVAQACTIRPGDELIAVEFSDISTSSLYLNTRTPSELFYIHLQDCDTQIADSVTATFSGAENAELPGLLALATGSAARGIAIGLEAATGQPLPLNVVSPEQLLNNGDNAMVFYAYVRGEPTAIANESIRKGRFVANSTFTLAYP